VPATAPYTVLVANGSGLPGVAGKTTTFLASKGITTLKAVDANTSDVPETVVYFTEGYQAQAQAVAQQLGGVQVAGLVPNPPPVADLGGANVLVVVGKKPIPGVTA
jgi:LytR cell envelope-related transcriptional attenuator